MTNPSPSPTPGHKRYFFEKFGITERLLERCLGEALAAGGDTPTCILNRLQLPRWAWTSRS